MQDNTRDAQGRFIKGSHPAKPDFWSYVDTSGICWLWIGAKTPGKWPYGMYRYDGKAMQAHRVAWILTHGPILPGFLVLHRCDNPPCVHPDHLFLGTLSDNMRDAWQKNRGVIPRHRGEEHAMAKLTWQDVRTIRALRDDAGMTLATLGAQFHVDQSTIGKIVNHKLWKE